MDMPNICSVSSRDFVLAMRDRWQALGNVTSPTLETLWSTMSDTFRAAAEGNTGFICDNRWRVLEPPTGTGKTQGLCVYAALVMQKNVLAAHPLGMLVVTRTIAQADEIVATIRELVGFTAPGRCVVAKHSGNKTTPSQMQAADVLVICHEAYRRSLCDDAWEPLLVTDFGGRRALTVVDEALAGIIDERQVRLDDVHQVLAALTPSERRTLTDEVTALEDLYALLESIGNNPHDAGKGPPQYRRAWSQREPCSLAKLREVLLAKPREGLLGHDADKRREVSAALSDTIEGCERLMASWAYLARLPRDQTLNGAGLIIPPQLPGVVVLDATARQNMIWELMEDRAERVAIPTKARQYGNVTLHLARTTGGLGKGTMRDRAVERFTRLAVELERHVGPAGKVLVACHKDVLPTAEHVNPNVGAYRVASYGKIDGMNDWNDYSAVAVMGLYYREPTWTMNAFMALQGSQDDDWMNYPARWKQYGNIRQELVERQLTATIVQAINRVRCRRVVDGDGNCAPTDVFLVLPSGSEGDAILQNLKEEMPGIQVVDWDFQPDGPRAQVRCGSTHEAVLKIMDGRRPGDLSLNKLPLLVPGLTARSLKDLKRVLRDPTHPLSKALGEQGVRYVSKGPGRGKSSYLRKEATK